MRTGTVEPVDQEDYKNTIHEASLFSGIRPENMTVDSRGNILGEQPAYHEATNASCARASGTISSMSYQNNNRMLLSPLKFKRLA